LFPESLIWAIVSVFVVGLGGTIGLMAVMKDARAFEPGQILGLSFMSFVAMLAVEAVLIYKLLSRGREEKVSEKSKLKATTLRDLEAASGFALPEPLVSVTENTTRTLEPIFRERK
jgi:heme A synthase